MRALVKSLRIVDDDADLVMAAETGVIAMSGTFDGGRLELMG